MTIQSAIQARLDSYPPSMRRVADVVLQEPDLVIRSTIATLAVRCQTSEATIVRFCRTLRLTGFMEFRVALAAELGLETARRSRARLAMDQFDLVDGSSLEQIVSTIAYIETLSVEETVAKLDMDVFRRAVERLDAAVTIYGFGVGTSGSCAKDLCRKLARIGRPAHALRDVEEVAVSGTFMNPEDALIAFSHTGVTNDVVRAIQLASQRGAGTIVVTNDVDSPAARAASLVIETSVRETSLRSASLGSRTAQSLVSDCLYGALAFRDLPHAQSALRDTGTLMGILRSGAPVPPKGEMSG
jgi:DNA-binding MurR/RpiR family transcriptional regulator